MAFAVEMLGCSTSTVSYRLCPQHKAYGQSRLPKPPRWQRLGQASQTPWGGSRELVVCRSASRLQRSKGFAQLRFAFDTIFQARFRKLWRGIFEA